MTFCETLFKLDKGDTGLNDMEVNENNDIHNVNFLIHDL